MEINNKRTSDYFSLDKSPLRQKPNHNQIDQRKYTSAQHQSYYDNEEEEYNRRRSEVLRKQMQSSTNSYQQNHQKPLRQKIDSPEAYRSLERVPEKDNKQYPSSYYSIGSQSRGELPAHIKEHMQNIQSDNESLMRRLNLVIAELERVKKEKQEILERLQETNEEYAELSRLLNTQDNVDKVNKYMQDDLTYERDKNLKARQKIKELDLYRKELIRELKKLQDLQEVTVQENKEFTYQLQSRQSKIQDIEREIFFTEDKIKAINSAIEDSKKNGLEINADKTDLNRIVNQLLEERNDLITKLEHLTLKYDECVREISFDRSTMEKHHQKHAKFITAKLMFQVLEQFQKNRLQLVFQEINTYVSFDSKCHDKLNSLAQFLGKAGKFKMGFLFRQWYNNTLKPIGVKQQSYQLSQKSNSIYLMNKMYRTWREIFLNKKNQYDNKTKAVQKLWNYQSKGSDIELKRAFQIWKESLEQFKLKKAKVKKFLWKLHFNKLNYAMNIWINHNSNINNQVRLNLLSKEFSQKQYLTILYNNFKYQIIESKRKRHNILFHCMKSWKYYLTLQKFIMGSNVAAMHLRRQLNTNLLKSCFDALKQNRETEKFRKIHYELNENERPKIVSLGQENEYIIQQKELKRKTMACESVKKMLAKQLYTYFKHWQQINEDYKEKLRTTVKDKIIQLYMETIRKAFNHWKVNHSDNKITSQQMIITDMQEEQLSLQNEIMNMDRENQQKQEQRDCCKHKSTLKCVESYQKRMKQLAIGRWRDRVNELNIQEDGAATIIRRLRLRFLRKAFDFYLDGVQFKKQMLINEERCQMYKKTRDERLKKNVYNAWHLFRKNHIKAKNYWFRIFLRLENTMKMTAVKKWREITQLQIEQQFEQEQSNVVAQIDSLNHKIGELHLQETCQKAGIQEQKGKMTQQARRIIANAFARYYYTNETRGFEQWKEFVNFQKKKERLLKKYLDHMMKYQFYFVKSTLKNWILNCKIQERKDQLKKEEQKVNDVNFQLELQNKNYDQTCQQLNQGTEEEKQLQKMYNERMQKTVKMIIRKIDNNHFTGQKRYILQQWREYVKREVAFIKCIQNVISKSLWNKGFQFIKNHNREVQKDTNKEIVMNKFRIKFWKATCGNAFSVWRGGQFKMATSTIQETNITTQKLIEDHQERKTVIKNNNMLKAVKALSKNGIRNLFISWRNVSKYMKKQRIQNEEFQKEMSSFWKKCSLRKWQSRKQSTKLARLRMKRLKEKYYTIKIRLYFNALKEQYNIISGLCQRISNLGNIHDLQNLKTGFNAIKSFVNAKDFVFQKRKENSSQTIGAILEGILQRRTQQYFTTLKIRCLNKRMVDKVKGFTIMYNIGNQLRYYFQSWKNKSNERTLLKEMNEEGPVREQVFEQRIIFTNLVDLMQKEGYEDKDIANALNEEKERQAQVLLKGVRRMQHYYDDELLKPKCLDKWKQFIHNRKLYKYWLGYIDKRGVFIKSDLHYAFDKWKNYYNNKYKELQGLPKSVLNKRIIKNNHTLEKLSDRIQNKENEIDIMDQQRDQLIDNYIKAQKLALTLWKNYQKQSLHHAFLRWAKAAKSIQNSISTSQLRENLELIENLKERIKHLESHNETMANENEELRQFSLDGYSIAKNVQALTVERERLSIDLADKTQVIRQLLEENDKLTSKLKVAQEEAQVLINSTMAGSSGFKTGKKGYSPVFKSSFKS